MEKSRQHKEVSPTEKKEKTQVNARRQTSIKVRYEGQGREKNRQQMLAEEICNEGQKACNGGQS